MNPEQGNRRQRRRGGPEALPQTAEGAVRAQRKRGGGYKCPVCGWNGNRDFAEDIERHWREFHPGKTPDFVSENPGGDHISVIPSESGEV